MKITRKEQAVIREMKEVLGCNANWDRMFVMRWGALARWHLSRLAEAKRQRRGK